MKQNNWLIPKSKSEVLDLYGKLLGQANWTSYINIMLDELSDDAGLDRWWSIVVLTITLLLSSG